MTVDTTEPVCGAFVADVGGAHRWCSECGWQESHHVAPGPRPRFGDAVSLLDGREGQVTFVDADHVRFVETGDQSQCWTWERIDSLAAAPSAHRAVKATQPRTPLVVHDRPSDGKECGYLPITADSGVKFCTKCGWSSGANPSASSTEPTGADG